jgi:hypothetical protein
VDRFSAFSDRGSLKAAQALPKVTTSSKIHLQRDSSKARLVRARAAPCPIQRLVNSGRQPKEAQSREQPEAHSAAFVSARDIYLLFLSLLLLSDCVI